MRGTTNRYKAEAVKLFGEVLKWVVKINDVPCLELLPSRKPSGYVVARKMTTLYINWDLVNKALANS